MRTLSTWLLIPLAAAALLAGCGSSSSSSSSSSGSTPSTTATASSTTPSTTSATGATKNPAAATAVESCRRGAKAIPTLSSSTRSKIEAICEKAGTGDVAATRVAAVEVCEAIVKASPLPEGSVKHHAIERCKSAEKK
jgi:uncharacterized protein YceK